MGTDPADWAARLPRLFTESYVDYAQARTTYVALVPPDHLVTRLHVVAVTGDALVVVCRSVQGWRFLPGGTREAGETLDDLARRELREEAGAELRGDLVHFSRTRIPCTRTCWPGAEASRVLERLG